jgi:hypothetical protein
MVSAKNRTRQSASGFCNTLDSQKRTSANSGSPEYGEKKETIRPTELKLNMKSIESGEAISAAGSKMHLKQHMLHRRGKIASSSMDLKQP